MSIYVGTTEITAGRLPSTYQEVEYIQSSGTQHINTLHKHTANTKFEIKFNYQSQSGSWNMICGSRTSYNTSDCMNLYLHNSNYIAYGVGGTYNDNFYSSSINTDYVVSLSKTNITINGSSTSLSTSLTNYSYNDWIFGVNSNNSQVEQKVKMKLYYFKIYEGDTLVRDFIPCYRKSDNVIGLYDLVNNQFYTNAGSGTFTKGSNVGSTGGIYVGTTPVKAVYVGTTKVRPDEVIVTQTYDLTKTSQSVYKSGYKITQVVLEYTCSYNTSGWQDGGSTIANNANGAASTANAACAVPGGYQRGCDYNNNGRWGRVFSDFISSGYGLVAFQQSSTTNAQCSVQMIWTRESLSYKVGKTYNNWLEQNTVSLNSTWKTNIATVFDSVNAGVYYRGRGQNSVTAKAIVTYTPD